MIRKKLDMKAIRAHWDNLASKFIHKWTDKEITPKEKSDLQASYDVLKKEGVSYHEYKKHFVKIAQFVGLSTNDIILENIVFKKDESTKKDKIAVRYSKGKQKVIIPNGTCLLHVSPNKKIEELKPTFRSKTVGKYMYPSPRVFFTLSKMIKPTQAGLEHMSLKKYTPVDAIQTAYIDPTYTDHKTGSIYVETNFPIKVTDFDKKMHKMMKESTEFSDIDSVKLMIYEACHGGLITNNQLNELMMYLN